jgi:HK97 gp10 family phage protein
LIITRSSLRSSRIALEKRIGAFRKQRRAQSRQRVREGLFMATSIKGREKLLAKMKALPPQVRSALKQALALGADEITDMQKRLVTVKSGDLRDSIVQTWGGGKVKYSSLSGSVGEAGDPDLSVRISAGNTKVRYAHLVEFGTAPHVNGGKFAGSQHPGAAAKRFFFPAYRALRKRVKSRITRATNKAAKQVAGK